MNDNFKTPFSDLKNKTNRIKDWYSPEFVTIFGEVLNQKGKTLDSKKFLTSYSKSYKTLEMKSRVKLIAELVNTHIEGDFKFKLSALNKLMFKEWPHEEGMMNYGFYLYPVAQFVEDYGHQDVHASLDFIKLITKRFTGEFAIRPIANAHPELTLKTMKLWSKDKNFHVRRLASEGLRAKLPWGMKIKWVHENPEKTLPIYNALRNDPSLYVRRSVANSMGDIIKINEPLAYKTLQDWLSKKQTPENIWVIKHAIRHPAKKKIKKYLDLRIKLKTL